MSTYIGSGMSDSNSKFGSFIRERRIALNMSQETFARKTGVKQSALSRWERGLAIPQAIFLTSHIDTIAQVLNCTPREIFNLLPEDDIDSKNKLGIFIRSRRKALGISLYELSVKMKQPHWRIKKLETEGNTLPYQFMHSLALILNVKISELSVFLNGSEVPKNVNVFASYIRTKRLELGMRQQDLGKKIGTSAQYISRIELGLDVKSKSGREKIAIALGVDPQELEDLHSQSI